MDKSPDAFRTISEVADWLGVPAHVLRFWESKFTHVKPVKRAGGRRYYRPADMSLLGGIKKLLHDDGLTIKGVQKILREQGVAHVSSLSQQLGEQAETLEATAGSALIEIDAVPVDPPTTPDQITPPMAEPVQDDTPPELIADQVIPEAPVTVPSAPFPAQTVSSQPVGATEETTEQPAKPLTTDPLIEPVVLKGEPQGEAAALPSFLHRRAAPQAEVATEDTPRPDAVPEAVQAAEPEQVSEPATETTTDSPTESAPEPVSDLSATESEAPVIRAHIVDAPDPPRAEDEIPYAPGPLASLSRIDSLSAEQARQIAPLAKELQAWLERPTGARPA